MNKYKKYYGIIIFAVAVLIMVAIFYALVVTKWQKYNKTVNTYNTKQEELGQLQAQTKIVAEKLNKIKNSISGAQKKIYSPVESDLGNDTLFFTLYSDLIEMVHTNSVRIKSIDYKYNPKSDAFFEHGDGVYFVCEVNMELISNYTNLGKLIQDIYQYPYYIKINKLEVKPFEKDKTVLISNLSLRLYAHTAPKEEQLINTEPAYGTPTKPNNAQ